MTKRWLPRCGVAALVSLSLVATACGADDESTSSDSSGGVTSEPADAPTSSGTGEPSSTAAPTDVNPDGVLKFGYPLISGAGVHFDPITMHTGAAPFVPWRS